MSFYLNILIDWLQYLSIILVILNVIIYYFGKLISSIRPQREAKIMVYLNGLLFSAIIIGAPLVVIHYFSEILLSISFWAYLLITLIIVYFLSKRLTAQHLDYNSVKDFADSRFKKLLESIIPLSDDDYLKVKKVHNYINNPKIRNIEGIIISLLVLSFFYKSLFLENIALTFISALFLFFALSSIATLYGWRSVKRPQIEVKLKDKTKIKGNFKKFQNDYLELIVKEKNVVIPLNSINYFESDIFNKKSKLYKDFIADKKDTK